MSTSREKDQKYSAKWKSLAHFMQHNTGLHVGSVAKAGSRRTGTPSEYSDLDIIFYIPGDPSKELTYIKLIKLIHANFSEVIAEFGDERNVINMTFGDLDFDIILLEESKFKSQVHSYKIEKI